MSGPPQVDPAALKIVSERWRRHHTPLGMWYEIRGRNCRITLEPRPSYCDRGNWIAKITAHGRLALELDHQDGWPRYYMDRVRAMQEVEDWMKKRGEWSE